MRLFQTIFHAMGGPCDLRFFHVNENSANEAFTACKNEAWRFEKKYCRYLDDSVISRINQHADSASDGLPKALSLDQETTAILNYAQTAFHISEGLFDITSGVLRSIWDLKTQKIPIQQEIDACLKHIGWEKVKWDQGKLVLPSNMQLDFGGIVKEYAADALKNIALAAGVTQGLINLGGDIVIINENSNATQQPPSSVDLNVSSPPPHSQNNSSLTKGWPIGIRHPDLPDAACCHINLTSGAMATSGDYEKFFIKDEHRYCHIFNPKTGYPVSNAASVTVFSPFCVVAGTLSTIGMLLPIEQAVSFLKQYDAKFILTYREGSQIKIISHSN